ncbi:MAG TPA: PQQ-dependent sugar dehydrogenase [Alphaproteobacteria bacterium]|nr:PQQ-dependent sugar dehydrogenase [Alphaproteobacteria bacterium]
MDIRAFHRGGVMLAALALAAAVPAAHAAQPACPATDTGIALSPGFCATVFADDLGHVRHMVVAPDGVLYVNTWSGRYYHNVAPPTGGFLIALRDTKGVGRADDVERFGPGAAQGAAGGTGIALYRNFIYAEVNDRIVRYRLPATGIAPLTAPETILSGLPLTGDHPMHPFVIDAEGHLYVDLGSATNACQKENRMPGSPGLQPCTELETRAGIWRYDANKTDQAFSPAERYSTGLRNGEGLAFDAQGRLFATMHGRDQLQQNWPRLYSVTQGAELPSEELVELRQGADFGWPECYFDGGQNKLVLAPEYGGDGGKKIGDCAQKQAPVAAFPAHWAPNDLLIYTATAFPKPYQGGAFIAFHGSWNRAPEPQGGYNVVFQPLADGKAPGGKAPGKFIVFADGFAGGDKTPGGAAFRPTGLAQAPDGALFISDDVHGRIWRVTWQGGTAAALASAPSPKGSTASSGNVLPPEGIHPNAGRAASALPVPSGATRQQVALGRRIFEGQAAGGTCAGCHGADAKGTSVGPNLASGKFLWSDGSLAGIKRTIEQGVAHPKQSTGAMPPKGGAPLSPQDVSAVAAYVWALGHQQNPTTAEGH